ncbi:DNA/RNA non-specific endonuclease [Enterococcus sp. AZ103]|uniref:DNA/RNA non-specific endonuclease n=1 Tax=Enterococcus sp. AZ103 TaxID=2774628 RepID=UPI003F22EFBB
MKKKKKKKSNKGLLGALIPIDVGLFVWRSNYLDTEQTPKDQTNITINSVISNLTMTQDAANLGYDSTNEVVTINNNQANFNQEDLSLANGSWQTFSDLDNLNRVGVANALLGYDLMPTEERGDISSVYPTGWKQKKLSNGKWLYNRSHLIGYQLTGENDNWKNLFTGTEQMNQGTMVQYENQVADYLRQTKNHVRYRVTPYFKDNELLCRGVQMEAQSVEDNTISYNVFFYNVEDGYTLDYVTGENM